MRLILLIAALVSIGCAPGCSDKVCTSEATYGVGVELRDDVTQEPICFGVLSASNGVDAHPELLRLWEGECFWYGVTRPGTYSVTVTASGYAPKTVEGVVVTDDECGHAKGVRLTIDLHHE